MSEYKPILRAPVGANKKPKRVGRGSASGLGTTAGKGNKGQQSRSGKHLPYVGFEGGQMPLYRRIAQRGFSNARFSEKAAYFNVAVLEAKFEAGETVNRDSLIAKNLLPKRNAAKIKILAHGDITKNLIVKVDAVSKSAKEKIEKAGGSVEAAVGQNRKERNAAHAQKKAAAQKRAGAKK